MKSKEGDKYLGKHLNSINDLLEEGHDPKVRDLVVYEDAKILSDISYFEGYDAGVSDERNKEDYEVWMVELFKKIAVDGLPKEYKGGHSKICVCFVPAVNGELDRYVIGYYNYNKKGWMTCLCEGCPPNFP
jgi:hypothetical protein